MVDIEHPWRWVVVLLLAAAIAGFGAGTGTVALLTDSQTANATIAAADTFDGTPPGSMAWDDDDGDRVWDVGEPTYDESELYDFSNTSVDLIVPADVGPVDSGSISITVGSIETRVPIQASSGDVTLDAANGDVLATDQDVVTTAGAVSITASGAARLYNTSIESTGVMDVTAERVNVSAATLQADFPSLTVAATNGAGGPLRANGTTVGVGLGNVVLESDGDMYLEGASIQAPALWIFWGEATADLGTPSATLHVAGTTVDDADDTLVYDPDGITVDPAGSGVVSPT